MFTPEERKALLDLDRERDAAIRDGDLDRARAAHEQMEELIRKGRERDR